MDVLYRAVACFFCTLLFSSQVLGQYLRYLDLGSSTTSRARAMAVDSMGDVFVASNIVEPSGQVQIRVTKTGPKGVVLAVLDFGGTGLDTPTGAAVDLAGNLIVVGNTSSVDFPVVSPILANTSPSAGFLVKINPQLTQILTSTRIGGTATVGGSDSGTTSVSAVTIDTGGNLYITGNTTNSDFPVTANAFQTQGPVGDGLGIPTYAFLLQITPAGKIGYATYFGGKNTVCIGGSSCIGVFGRTAGTTLAVDATGTVTIAGNTTASDLPVTAGTFGSVCLCTNKMQVGFIAQFAPGGAHLQLSTYLTNAVVGQGDISISSVILDQSNDIIVGGTAPYGFGTNPGVVGSVFPGGNPPPSSAPYAGFVRKIDPAATRYLFSTYLGGNVATAAVYAGVNGVTSLALGPQGSIIAAGGSLPAGLPVPEATPLLGNTYVANLSSDGTKFNGVFTAPQGAVGQGVAVTGQGNIVALGTTGSLLIYPLSQVPSLVGAVGAAAYQTSGQVAPFEIISLYGNGIGPSSALFGQIVNGALVNALGGTQVLFDGVAAPLLYAGPNQINVVVPRSVGGKSNSNVAIVNAGGTATATLSLAIVLSQPQVFSNFQTNGAAALNQDGTVNAVGNPAAGGSIVTVWATGAGSSAVARPDGTISSAPYQGPILPVSVVSLHNAGTDSLEVLYAGDAPGLVQGTMQVNFRLPSAVAAGAGATFLALQVGDRLSPLFQLYVKP